MFACIRLAGITAIALFATLSAAALAQSNETTSGVVPATLVASTGANTPSNIANRPSVVVSTGPIGAVTDEQKGDYLLLRKQYQAAVEAYSHIPQASAAVWNKMGIAYQMLLDQKSAAHAYHECLKLEPSNSGALNNLATIEDERKNFAAAERLYRQAIEAQPSARLLKNLGTNYLLQHKYQESSEAYAQAVALDPHIFEEQNGPTAAAPATVKDCGEVAYLEARSCARAGLNNCAIEQLRHSFNQGFATGERVRQEEDFARLRHIPEYERLLAEHKEVGQQ